MGRRHPPATVHLGPCDLGFGAGRILQPDLLVVVDGLPRDAAARSTEAGVPEYRIVDLQQIRVQVFHGSETAAVVTDALESEDQLTPLACAGAQSPSPSERQVQAGTMPARESGYTAHPGAGRGG